MQVVNQKLLIWGKTASKIFPQYRYGVKGPAVPIWGMKKFPNKIRTLRKENGWTLEELAERSGISVSTLQRLETGERQLKTDHMDSLAKAFGCSPADILDSASTIPVFGYVGLGEEVDWHGEGDQVLEEIDVPGIRADRSLGALIGRGQSMWPRVTDGEVIIYRRNGKTASDLLNREAVVKVRDGPVLFKRIRMGSLPHIFRLESHNAAPREAELEWVGELVSILPEGAWRKH